MATLQITRNKATETLNKTAITQKQSVDVVQTMLHGGLSCITYLRSLFTEKAYEEQLYDSSKPIQSYEDYAAGRPAEGSSQPDGSRTKLQVLRKGRSRRVDSFLNWLEYGAFPALRAGNLRCIEIYVHPDRNSREKVLETYTFTVKYHPHSTGSSGVADIDLDGPRGSSVSVGVTNQALGSLLRRIMEVSQDLPSLPDQRYLSMSIFYTNEIDLSHCPMGFEPNNGTKLLFASSKGWKVNKEDFGALDVGLCSTSLSIFHLQPSLSAIPPWNFKIPSDLQYSTESQQANGQLHSPVKPSAEANASAGRLSPTPSTIIENAGMAIDQMAASPAVHNSSSPQGHSPPQRQPSARINSSPPGARISRDPSFPGPSQHLLSQFSDIVNTQSSNIPQMRRALGAMMQAEYITQGDTQPLSQPFEAADAGDGTRKATSRRTAPPLLSQSVAARLEQTKADLSQMVRKLARPVKKGRSDAGDLVLCQCGNNETEGEMVECSYCHSWQHLHCYGYTAQDDERLPEHHVCYRCLLGDSDQDTLTKLKDLIAKRRAAHIAFKQGLRTQTDLATTMRTSTSRAKGLIEDLKKEGYVVPVKGSRAAGYAATGKPYLVVCAEGPRRDRMVAELFDPLMHISHYYDLPSELPTQLETAQPIPSAASQKGDMPPPVTPASQLRRRKATETPASNLDLHNTATPYRTPFRKSSEQTLPLKRSAVEQDDEETIDESPMARSGSVRPLKRSRSIRTELVLDAAGLSSSPAYSTPGC